MTWLLVILLIASCCFSSQRKIGTGSEEATIMFAGDISFDGPAKYFAEVSKTCNYTRPFDRIKNHLMEADLRVVNLESPLLNVNSHAEMLFPSKGIHHRGNSKAAAGLKYAGFDLVQLANNHMADYGGDGIQSTMDNLRKLGISYIGVSDYSMRRGVQEPFIRDIHGVKIGILAYCWNYEGCGALRCDKGDRICRRKYEMIKPAPTSYVKSVAMREISKLKRRVDIVIILMHWSKERAVIPALKIRSAARGMKLAGANMIIGTHPHVVQGHECFAEHTLVIYSLGDFLMPKAGSITSAFLAGRKVSEKDVKDYLVNMNEVFSLTQQAYVAKVTINRHEITSAEYLPIEIRSERTTNCLQPVPRGKWVKICSTYDIYCHDFRTFYANSLLTYEEQLLQFSAVQDLCIKTPK